jgi:hypothetical protein
VIEEEDEGTGDNRTLAELMRTKGMSTYQESTNYPGG